MTGSGGPRKLGETSKSQLYAYELGFSNRAHLVTPSAAGAR